MIRRIMAFGLLSLGFLLASCDGFDSWQENIDQFSFRSTGGTLFSEPNRVTTKELHFDTGILLGRVVILEGKIEEVGDFETYAVISDDSGRMLVVLTNIDDASEVVKGSNGQGLKVLGTVERGKKGLPFILAKSINIH